MRLLKGDEERDESKEKEGDESGRNKEAKERESEGKSREKEGDTNEGEAGRGASSTGSDLGELRRQVKRSKSCEVENEVNTSGMVSPNFSTNRTHSQQHESPGT